MGTVEEFFINLKTIDTKGLSFVSATGYDFKYAHTSLNILLRPYTMYILCKLGCVLYIYLT